MVVKQERKPTSIEVELLNREQLDQDALDFYLGDYPDSKVIKMSPAFYYGIVRTPNGIYGLCSEGVGSDKPITKENPMTLSFYSHKEQSDGVLGGSSMFPVVSLSMYGDALEKHIGNEKVNLADFIRSFGSRLESNYYD